MDPSNAAREKFRDTEDRHKQREQQKRPHTGMLRLPPTLLHFEGPPVLLVHPSNVGGRQRSEAAVEASNLERRFS